MVISTGKGGCRKGEIIIHGEGTEPWKSSAPLKSHTIKCSQFELLKFHQMALKYFPANIQSPDDEKTILEVYIAQHSEAALGFAHLRSLCNTQCVKSQVSGNHLILLVLLQVEDLSPDVITKSI